MTAIQVAAFLDADSETFSYVVYEPTQKDAVVIDPVLDFDYKSGRTSTAGAQRLVDFIRQQQLKVAWILETHAHADHLSAAPFMQEEVGGKLGIGEHIRQVQAIFKEVYGLEKEFLPNGHQFDHLFSDGEVFQVGLMTFRVMHTPGHTPADVCFVVNEQLVFVGDTLFMPDVGTARCDFPGGDAATLYQSIQRILALPPATKIYICHDYPPAHRDYQYQTTVAAQRDQNIHVKTGISQQEFVAMRNARDATLAMPRLILPAIQVNIRAGHFPPPAADGQIYLKLPINRL